MRLPALRLAPARSRFVLGVALLGLLAAGLAALASWRDRPELVLDVGSLGDRSLDLVACDDEGVWLKGWSRAPTELVVARGFTAAFATQRASLVRVARDGALRELDLGEALVAGFSLARDGALWVVLLDVATERSRTRVSADGGRTWTDAGAPADVHGVAFASRQAGWAWSDQRVYRTDDGGRSWRPLDLAPYGCGRSDATGSARLGPRGELWLPLDRFAGAAPGLPSAKLVVVEPDLSRVDVAAWPEDRIQRIALDGDDGAIAAVSPPEGGFRLERVARRPGAVAEPSPVRALRRTALQTLAARGPRVLLLEGDATHPLWVLANLPATLSLSRDRGATFRARDVTDTAAGSACLAEHGAWTVSERYRRVAFYAD